MDNEDFYILFPSTCQFCNKRFRSPNLSNCCFRCWKVYKKMKIKYGSKKLAKKHTLEKISNAH